MKWHSMYGSSGMVGLGRERAGPWSLSEPWRRVVETIGIGLDRYDVVVNEVDVLITGFGPFRREVQDELRGSQCLGPRERQLVRQQKVEFR